MKLCKARETERSVKCVMGADSEVRKKVKDMSDKSKKALMAGGSALVSLGDLVDTLFA